ncbi:MAG: Protein of unknown function (DUF2721) [Phormidesmis priestleyi Ana]|uniref:Uncharacterized protein n=1 Tax=Phormidesmis priestleyi Ana TaxID=1666911 RepID=A0A0P7ZRW9_9CYAN|nr:MAG: Protein of unknown function (DUF2721) [Phormidesmis priestleyi Ana]
MSIQSNKVIKQRPVPMGIMRAGRRVMVLCGGWALLSALLFVGFALGPPSLRTDWFPTVVSLLKIGAFLIAAVLCWRNIKDKNILSSPTVWQAIALSMAAYALGDITVMLWRSLWGITTVVSLGDMFYAASYLFLMTGLLKAVLPRPINLNWMQGVSIVTVGIAGIVLAFWINFYMLADVGSSTILVAPVSIESKGAAMGGAVTSPANTSPANTSPANTAPQIIQILDQRLGRLSSKMSLLYVAGDCVVIVVAVLMLIAFWGGIYSESWKLIAIAGLCLYGADLLLVYHVSQGSYRQGASWEILWVLSALFFGMGAAVERGVSSTVQQKRDRRQRVR